MGAVGVDPAGLVPGDRILRIDTTSTFDLKHEDIRLLTSGPNGYEIDLRLFRNSGQIENISVALEYIEIDSVPFFALIDDEIGYVRLSRFSEECSDELIEIINILIEDGMRSLILDLRDNPGGLLLEAVNVASIFLPANIPIVETRGKNNELKNQSRWVK